MVLSEPYTSCTIFVSKHLSLEYQDNNKRTDTNRSYESLFFVLLSNTTWFAILKRIQTSQ